MIRLFRKPSTKSGRARAPNPAVAKAASATPLSSGSADGSESRSGPSSSKAAKLNVSLSAWLRLVRPKSSSRASSRQTTKLSATNLEQTSELSRQIIKAPSAVLLETETPRDEPITSQSPQQSGQVTISPTRPPGSSKSTNPGDASAMAERTLQQIITQLKGNPSYEQASSLLSKAKLSLLQLKALTPTPKTPSNLLSLARDVYELGALTSIRARNPDAFTRYVQQLQPFYELPSSQLKPNPEARNKVTGLYLLLLLTQGRYDVFHSELESLSMHVGNGGFEAIEADRFLGYPIKLERWLMEGSYDRVWKAMKKGEVPSEEFGVFSQILTSQIRSEIASSSERAYPSLPLSSTKSLLFLDSEGAVVEFARQRGWVIRDGQIYFPAAEAEDGEEKDMSQMVIENTLGYARELETIV
ncbi:26S proteasome regulatory subunit rpn12 [Seiridium cupressi]